MPKFIALFLFIFLIFSSHAFAQGTVEMDAIAFARDSGYTQVEIYYTVQQGAMPFEQRSDGWHITITARAELWEGGHVIAAKDIRKEKIVRGSKASFDSTKGDLILDGVALSGIIKTEGEAALIFLFKNGNGQNIADTIKRHFVAPVISPGKYSLGGIEIATSLTPTTDRSNPFEKVGFIITPNPSKLFAPGNTKLSYYSELYTPSSPGASDCEIITRVLDGAKHLMFTNVHRQPLESPITPVVGSIDVDGLPSDSYTLQVEVKSGAIFDVTADKQFFFDDGMKVSEDESQAPNGQALDEESIYATSGIANMAETEVLEKGNQAMYIAKSDQQKSWKKLKEKSEAIPENSPEKEKVVTEERKFLYAFWRAKDVEMGSRVPLTAFHIFYKQVDEVNKKFTTQKTPGWETDFGRIYLTYGAPEERNIIKELHSIDAKPIVAWQYTQLNVHLSTTDRVTTERMDTRINYNYPTFVFVDKLGGGNFMLVHSNVQGETSEPEWYTQEARRIH